MDDTIGTLQVTVNRHQIRGNISFQLRGIDHLSCKLPQFLLLYCLRRVLNPLGEMIIYCDILQQRFSTKLYDTSNTQVLGVAPPIVPRSVTWISCTL